MTQRRVDHLGNLRVTSTGDVRVFAFGEDLAETVTIADTLTGGVIALSGLITEDVHIVDVHQTSTDLAGLVTNTVTITDTLTSSGITASGSITDAFTVADTVIGGIAQTAAIIENITIRDGYLSPDDAGGVPRPPVLTVPGIWIQELVLRGRATRPFV